MLEERSTSAHVHFALLSSCPDHLIMAFVALEEEDASWAQPPKEPGDIVKDAIKKEQMIKCVGLRTDGWPWMLTFVKSTGI